MNREIQLDGAWSLKIRALKLHPNSMAKAFTIVEKIGVQNKSEMEKERKIAKHF